MQIAPMNLKSNLIQTNPKYKIITDQSKIDPMSMQSNPEMIKVYRVDGHLVNIHSIRTGNIVARALNRVNVREVMAHPVQFQCPQIQSYVYILNSPENENRSGKAGYSSRLAGQVPDDLLITNPFEPVDFGRAEAADDVTNRNVSRDDGDFALDNNAGLY